MAEEKDKTELTEVDTLPAENPSEVEEKPAGEVGSEDHTILVSSDGKRVKKNAPPYLVIVDGPFRGSRFPLHDGRNTVGRLPSSTVVLDDQSVSRQHAAINFSAEGWIVQDLQSKNGTLVNGALIGEPVTIGHKDLLRFGIYTLRLITQEVSNEEEMAMVPEAMRGEEGVEAQPASEATDTEALPPKDEVPLSEGTDQHIDEEKLSPKPKSRLGLLAMILFVFLLGGGLYTYWNFFLSPKEKIKKEGKSVSVATPIEPNIPSLPMSPKEPPPPQKVPVFLDFVASPLPAMVYFEKEELGKTPLKVNIQLQTGESYNAEAVFDMPEIQEHYSASTRFVVDSNQSVIPVLFRAPIGIIKLEELPRDVSVYFEAYFDHNPYQARTIKLPQVTLNKPIYSPYGRYIMELRQPKQVGNPSEYVEEIILRREFILGEDRPTYSVVVNEETLKEFPLSIRSTPSEAEVFLDQRRVGVTPYEGMQLLGKHTLILRKDGYFEHSEEIAMDVNMPYNLDIALKTSAAGEKIIDGKNFYRRGAYEESIRSFAQAFDLTPTEKEISEVRYWLGLSYLRIKDFEKAITYLEQSKNNPEMKYWAMLGLAQAYGEQQQVPQALPYLVEVLLNAKEDDLKTEANQVFQKISPLRSIVYVYTEPTGADVYVNEKKITQQTPVILHDIALGNYRLRVEKAGYQVQELVLSISITEFKPVIINLRPNS